MSQSRYTCDITPPLPPLPDVRLTVNALDRVVKAEAITDKAQLRIKSVWLLRDVDEVMRSATDLCFEIIDQ